MPTKSPYFCVLPWYSKEINGTETSPCCLLPKKQDVAQLRKELLNGIAAQACEKCWNIESQGKDSRRIQENRFLDFKLDRDIELVEQDCINGNYKTLMYQITLSNLCNQACVTCNASNSTKWGELEYKSSNRPILVQKNDAQQLDIDYANARRIYILGGEPLFDPGLKTLLQKLLDAGNDSCFLSFVTNGSVRLSKEIKTVLKSFKDLNICISIDGIEKRFEYMRWPGKWSELLLNIDDYQSAANNNISVSYTVSAVNAIYFDETVEWFESRSLRYNHNMVYSPHWASIAKMPVPIKTYLKDHEFFQPWIDINGQENPVDVFLQELEKQDMYKKISLQEYMPDLYKLIGCA